MRHFALMILATALMAAERPLLHPLFSDHAVLQRGLPVPVWGWAAPGAKVAVTIAGVSAEGVANAEGRWEAVLAALPVGGPYELVVSGAGSATVQDVLVGDIWLCGGQSNMEMGVGVCRDAEREFAQADHPLLRLGWVRHQIATSPQDLAEITWLTCTPEALAKQGYWGGFSAAGYSFGREVQRTLNIPIGLISANWGGTPIETWLSAQALAALNRETDRLAWLRNLVEHGDADFPKQVAEWWAKTDPGTRDGYAQPAYADAAWPSFEQPGLWESRGEADLDGVVWLRRRITIPASLAGHDLVLNLGPVDDDESTWFDGELVGETRGWDVPRTYQIPARLATAGDHVLAMRVLDTGGAGGMHGQPEQLWLGVDGGERVSLTGAWQYQVTVRGVPALGDRPVRLGDNPNFPTLLGNGMLQPISGFPLAGAIWYQGESNAGDPNGYRQLLPALFADFRARFRNPALHVGVVQLASFMDRSDQPITLGSWAELRESQALSVEADPHASLAVAIDIGDAADIHPKNKQDVGRRLALGALAGHYNVAVVGSGPTYAKHAVEGATIRVHFTTAVGLTTSDRQAALAFALHDAAGWHHATAVIDGTSVVLSAAGVTAPDAVRYAWSNNPAVNLVNGSGLPAVPFRSDR